MTVASTTIRKTYAGDGATVLFNTSPVGFYVATDLQVYVVTNATGAQQLLVNGVDYAVLGGGVTPGSSVAATGSVNLGNSIPHGSVPFGAPAVGTTLVILRVLPETQTVDLVNGSPSDAEVQEQAFDRLTMQVQQLQDTINRSLALPAADVTGFSMTLPSLANRASKFLGFDSTGALIVAAAVLTAPFISPVAAGQIVFGAAAGQVNQDANLFWDNTLKRLTIPYITTPAATNLTLSSTGGAIIPNADLAQQFGLSNNRFSILFVQDVATLANPARTGYFGTSVVTPLVTTSGATNLGLGVNGVSKWNVDGTSGQFSPATDNTILFGAPTQRVAAVFTPIIDSGTTGALSFKTNNGTEQFRVVHTASAVNILSVTGSSTGTGIAQLSTIGTDTNIQLAFLTQGTGAYSFDTNSLGNRQLTLLHTASSTRNVIITGSNGGNPLIDVTAGALKLSGGTADIQWGKANVALGGGAAPTVGTIGGSGPATAAQRNWLRFIESDGTASFIPVWR